MNNQLFIPEKLKVGFQNRSDTFSSVLAYVVYFDQKNVLRKERSWQSWRDNKIEPKEFPNTPTEGFVLNRKVGGGGRSSYSWNARQEKVRIYDPRDFEFEITTQNLLFILENTGSQPGKALEGKFVYAWSGDALILVPEGSLEYKESSKFTKLQSGKVLSKDLIPGAVYETKKQEKLIFVGRRDYWTQQGKNNYSGIGELGKVRKYVFVTNSDDSNYTIFDDVSKLAVCISSDVVPDFSDIVERYNASQYATPAKQFIETGSPENPISGPNYWRDAAKAYEKLEDGSYLEFFAEHEWRGAFKNWKSSGRYYFIKDGTLHWNTLEGPWVQRVGYWRSSSEQYRESYSKEYPDASQLIGLRVECENGSQFKINYNSLESIEKENENA